MRFSIVVLCAALGLNCSALRVSAQEDPASMDYFEKHIRPVLIEKCYECHAADTEASGGLLLDSRPGWQKGGDSGAAIEPGKPGSSRLIKAIEYTETKMQMPPDGPLPKEVVKRFRDWIEAGANDPREAAVEPGKHKSSGLPVERATEHWSYRPLDIASIPTVPQEYLDGDNFQRDNAARNALDAFLLRGISEQDIPLATEAEAGSLLRRVSYDLHGLPPSPEQVTSFTAAVAAGEPDAFEREVDRMLASPRYAERMARRWMDVARYAESLTLRGFVLPQAWRYRDYLINAFAEDRPFDLFAQEQIAGDLMNSSDAARREQEIVATAFLALGNTNLEEQDKEQLEMDYIDEQLEVIGRVFMAQTIGCARCHDHKFDPIPQRDYYALAGIFKASQALKHENVSKWIEKPLPVDPEMETRFVAAEKQLTQVKLQEEKLNKQLGKKTTGKVEGGLKATSLPGLVIDDVDAIKVGEWKESSTIGPYVGSFYVHDLNDRSTPKSITFEPKEGALPPGDYQVRFAFTASDNRTSKAKVQIFSADGDKTVIVNQKEPATEDGMWFNLGTYHFEKNGQAFVLITNEDADGHVVVDAIQFLPTDDAAAKQLAKDNKDAKSVAAPTETATNKKPRKAKATAETKDSTVATADAAEADKSAQQAAMEKELKALKSERAKLEQFMATRPQAITIDEQLPARDLPINIRGNVHNVGAVVPRGFLKCAEFEEPPKFGEDTSGRRELARWLTDNRHPLTARVYANRLWHWTMGVGLVRTVDNFGTTGEQPSNAQLLDYLAGQLMSHDWSTSYVMRSLVTSAAYRRSTHADERSLELDPENRLFARAVRKRLDVESMRDSMLAISGELDFPGRQSTLKNGVKEDYRYTHLPQYRSVYQPVLRNSLPELYEAFDFPNPSISSGTRSQSVVSPQALAMMNSPWILARASHTARRWMGQFDVLSQASVSKQDWDKLLDSMFLEVLGRAPSDIERYASHALIEELEASKSDREQIVTRLVHGIFASIDFRYLY